MTERASGGRDETSPTRRLVLTPIGFDTVIALGQVPPGLRLSTLAHAIGSPVSSVQAALRVLVASGLAVRLATAPPRYRLNDEHPATESLATAALLLPDAAHAMAIALRASPAVELAVVDSAGFLVGLAGEAALGDRERLEAAIDRIRVARLDAPLIELVDQEELTRHLRVAVGLRDRVRRAILLKGRIPRGSASVGHREPVARGTQERCVRRSTSTPTSGRGSGRGRWGRTPS